MTTATQDHISALRDTLDEINVRIEILLDSPWAGISRDTGKDLEEIQVLINHALIDTAGAA